MSLVAHAERELEILAQGADRLRAEADAGIDDFQREINQHLLNLVIYFSSEDPGHSGSSAAYTIEMLSRLLSFQPLTPLTGAPDEWMEVAEEMVGRPGLFQNVRCGRVFLEGGVAYDVEAVVYGGLRGPDGIVGWDSARRVTFPYMPRTRHVPLWLRRPATLYARLRGQLRP